MEEKHGVILLLQELPANSSWSRGPGLALPLQYRNGSCLRNFNAGGARSRPAQALCGPAQRAAPGCQGPAAGPGRCRSRRCPPHAARCHMSRRAGLPARPGTARRGCLGAATHGRCSARIFLLEKWPQLRARSRSGKYLVFAKALTPADPHGGERALPAALRGPAPVPCIPPSPRSWQGGFAIRKRRDRRATAPTEPSGVCALGPFRFAEKNKRKKFPRWEI